MGPSGTTSPPTYLVEQGFETPTTGYDNGETWTETGTVVPNYTTTVIVGTQSCAVTGIFANTYTSYTGQTDVWAFCRIRFSTGINSSATYRHYFSIRAADDTVLASLKFGDAGGTPGLTANVVLETNGTETAASPTIAVLNTSYYVWMHFVSGGACTVAMSTTSTRPTGTGSGLVYLTQTGASGTAARIRIENADGIPIYDHILVSATTIGDNP